MAQSPRRPQDARSAAEAAFKKATAPVVEVPAKATAVPGVRELVSLRIDQDVLQHFQDEPVKVVGVRFYYYVIFLFFQLFKKYILSNILH